MFKQDQRGLTIIEIMLVVFVVAAVSLGGYYVWSKNRNQSDSAKQSPQAQDQPTLDNGTPSDQSSTEAVKTIKVQTDSFSVELPETWNHRQCSDHDGLGALVSGGDGEMRCIWSDAKWLSTDMASRGKVAIGKGSNPYPIQDYSNGTQKDLYESDATILTLKDGRKVKKFTYVAGVEGEKGKTFKVTEYVMSDNSVTVFVFEGHPAENGYENKLSTAEVIKIVENSVLPSIKQ